ncbi:UPF0688 protein C1orf174 homolog isoform 2-T2 [Aulostomus maculatus]
MPGQLNSLKSRKRKRSSAAKHSRKASFKRRRCVKVPKMCSAPESSSVMSEYSKAASHLERLSPISCECLQSAGRRRCLASPALEGQEGKENDLRMGLDLDGRRLYGVPDKQGAEDMDFDELGKNIFPDDDSNQILPVEYFFGNLDSVQDFPQRAPRTTSHVQKKRRRHYYARDDSEAEEEAEEEEEEEEEEEGFSSMQQDDREDPL